MRQIIGNVDHSSGFTLVELMVSIAIIATLSGIATPNYMRYRQKAIQVRVLSELKMIEKEIFAFAAETGSFPDSLADIGKIGIPLSILDKPARLDESEYEVVKTHPEIGARILEPIEAYADVLTMIEQHHERYDGNGYPNGISDPVSCPDELVGKWVTDAHPYADRFMKIFPTKLVFETGEIESVVFTIQTIEHEKTDSADLWTFHCEAAPGEYFSISLLHHTIEGRHILQFKNMPMLHWYRSDTG